MPAQPSEGFCSAREALEAVIEDAVVRAHGRAAVLFSGGRDSSAMLAVVTLVCRRLGADDPVPVTAVYPHDPDTDETSWQQFVLDHLGLRRRAVIEVTTQRRMLSAETRGSLGRWGTVWPVAVHTQALYFGAAEGAVFFTGEGGDGLLAGARITPLSLVRQDFPRVPGSLARAAAAALTPNPVYRRTTVRHGLDAGWLPWIRPAARPDVLAGLAATRGPLRWDRSRRGVLRQRSVELVDANSVVAAKLAGATLCHPLLNPFFVDSLAEDGGAWGFRGRTDVFRHLFADLLPDAILARTSKAAFNSSRWGDDERDFAVGWTGEGVDPTVVDPGPLRAEWLKERPHPVASFLVHDAWLATQTAAASDAGGRE
ncbi:asparagine synthase-related protein [Propionicicella superfundia]|uniref:asparagine synthase-related protein n=1 Tax=Propionicicella superfundia TaxID=348582 RepID=UPI000414C0B8|nr:asparagine synthase-related protein [Propionicicella superfundia]